MKPNALTGLLAVLGAPLACGLCFALLLVVFIGGTIPQLPAWAQDDAVAWMLGSATEGPGGHTAAGIGVGWDGYAGPGSAPSGVPFADTPFLGCLMHDPNYPSHTGVDFPVSEGVAVLTTMAGKVVWADYNGPWGYLVVIENNGIQTYYAHLRQINVTEGQILALGDSVGESGTTGKSTGPHLHYGIKQKTETWQVWLNPIDFFAGAAYTKVVCK